MDETGISEIPLQCQSLSFTSEPDGRPMFVNVNRNADVLGCTAVSPKVYGGEARDWLNKLGLRFTYMFGENIVDSLATKERQMMSLRVRIDGFVVSPDDIELSNASVPFPWFDTTLLYQDTVNARKTEFTIAEIKTLLSAFA